MKKYYIIRVVEDLELGFKLFNFDEQIKNFDKQIKFFHNMSSKFILDNLLNTLRKNLKTNAIVIYSNEKMEYLGWDYFDRMSGSSVEMEGIEFKVYLRKKKLEILNNYGKE